MSGVTLSNTYVATERNDALAEQPQCDQEQEKRSQPWKSARPSWRP
jgi:hypothetical protein